MADVTTCEERDSLNTIVMGIHKAVYVRDEDVELWQWAEAYARKRRMPTSGLVMAALEAYRAEHNDDDDGLVRR